MYIKYAYIHRVCGYTYYIYYINGILVIFFKKNMDFFEKNSCGKI